MWAVLAWLSVLAHYNQDASVYKTTLTSLPNSLITSFLTLLLTSFVRHHSSTSNRSSNSTGVLMVVTFTLDMTMKELVPWQLKLCSRT